MRLAVVLALAAAGLVACAATTTFEAFEVRGDRVSQGKGGIRTVHDGMEIWTQGDPPRLYRVIGIVDDRRPGETISMRQLLPDVIRKAREAGGQALIQLANQSRIVGYNNTGSATGSAYGNTAAVTGTPSSQPLRRNMASFLVIRYVD